MNLIEALETGLPLRRPITKHLGINGDGWLDISLVTNYMTGQYNKSLWLQVPLDIHNIVDIEDLMAKDWEVKKEYEKIELNNNWQEISISDMNMLLRPDIYNPKTLINPKPEGLSYLTVNGKRRVKRILVQLENE